MKTYKAIARGYNGKRIIEVGEEFQYEGKPGKWMKEVVAKPAGKAAAKGADDAGGKPAAKGE